MSHLCKQCLFVWLYCAGGGILCASALPLGQELSANVKRLVEESKKKLAIVETALFYEKPLPAADIPQALGHIAEHADYTAYHLLLAVREYHPHSYRNISDETKSAILCSALKNSIFLNDWGSLDPSGSYDRHAAKALLSTGKIAVKTLTALLEDNENAPLFGSEEATESKRYGYRRKDFAYRYISLILGYSPVFRSDPKDRDQDIESLKAKLKKNAK